MANVYFNLAPKAVIKMILLLMCLNQLYLRSKNTRKARPVTNMLEEHQRKIASIDLDNTGDERLTDTSE